MFWREQLANFESQSNERRFVQKYITDIEFIDRNLDIEEEGGKESRLDLLGRASDGTVVNLEIQVAKQEYMGRRSLYYWSRLYNELKSGEEYTELKRTVTINILDFNLFEKKKYPSYHNCFGVYDIKTGNQLTLDCELNNGSRIGGDSDVGTCHSKSF